MVQNTEMSTDGHAKNDGVEDVVERGEQESNSPIKIPASLAAIAALLVASLGMVGVSGEILTRSVRNKPEMFGAIAAALLLTVGWSTAWRLRQDRITGVTVGVVTVLLAATVGLGAMSVSDREVPRIALSSEIDGNSIVVTVDASAAGLASNEDMLVQVHGIRSTNSSPLGASSSSRSFKQRWSCGKSRFERYRKNREPSWPGPLLVWQQSGPTANGNTSSISKITIPAKEYQEVCGVAVLKGNGHAPRAAQAFMRIPD